MKKQLWIEKILNFINISGQFPKKMVKVDEKVLPLLLWRFFFLNQKKPLGLIMPDSGSGEEIFENLKLWRKILDFNFEILLLPEKNRGKIELTSGENAKAKALQCLADEKFDIVIGSGHAFANRSASPSRFKNSSLKLYPEMQISFNDLLQKLLDFDYDDELEVNIPGEFSRRGGIVDLYSPGAEFPVRLEFFGNTIESIRRFDCISQRSTAEIYEYTVISKGKPKTDDDKFFSAFNFLSDQTALLLFDEPEIIEQLERFGEIEVKNNFKTQIDSFKKHNMCSNLYSNFLPDLPVSPFFPPLLKLNRKMISSEKEQQILRRQLFEELERYIATGNEIFILASQSGQIPLLKNYCKNHDFPAEKLHFETGLINDGIFFPDEKFIVISENELSSADVFKKKNVFYSEKTLNKTVNDLSNAGSKAETYILNEINENDYIVHIEHGIGIFKQLKYVVDQNHVRREMLELEYQDEQKILIPINQSYLISRYIGAPGKVRLHKLYGSRWNSEKISALRSVKSYAGEMLRLQAVREVSSGISFPIDENEFQKFLDAFPFNDTPDQRKSTLELKAGMASLRPMDRLLCGDVGYGKTEIAMRAAFIAVNAGYQVALMAPTTILVQQHYESFCERFAAYPFIIENVSRFKTPREQTQIFTDLTAGKIDIIIGTQSLCGANVKFKKLGLLIIDEEQRFGVNHKEKLRRLRTEVDVLSMSATPIPRTLYMAMAGARDLSTLVTPPKERLPVKTLIAPENDKIISDAINFELSRSGQIFYLHNRVKTIEDCALKLKKFVPQCRVGIAHGQLGESEIESVMNSFIKGDIDCLVASTIIESGLDIPNANTIIIERADRFGLAELYQLRGRVGRWKHQAFAYLLLPKNMLISSDGRKRINAIRRCGNLGAGFQLALHDLEIRGAGNILGAEQSGHLNAIGFDLYCQLLKQEVANMKNNQHKFLTDPEIFIDFLVLADEAPPPLLHGAFTGDYIENETMRLGVYRKLAKLTTPEDLEDFKIELADRFGKLPPESLVMFEYAEIKLLIAINEFTSLKLIDSVVYLKKEKNIFRIDGKLPRISYANPPLLRLKLLKRLLSSI